MSAQPLSWDFSLTSLLVDDKWTSDETNYLFSLLKEYDLRFLVVADRYAYLPKQVRAGGLAQNRYAWPLALAGRKKAAAAPAGSRRSGRGTAGFVGEEGDDSRDGTPGVAGGDAAREGEAESVEALMMGEVKRRSIEVCLGVSLCESQLIVLRPGDQRPILYHLSEVDPE